MPTRKSCCIFFKSIGDPCVPYQASDKLDLGLNLTWVLKNGHNSLFSDHMEAAEQAKNWQTKKKKADKGYCEHVCQ